MTFSEHPLDCSGEEDARLEERAAALVNPVSGLANDYLNIFNEIVMLIDLLPDMPDLLSDIAAWQPVSYVDYFHRSPLPGRGPALAAYDELDPHFRQAFEAVASDIARLALGACGSVVDAAKRGEADSALAEVCAEAARALRSQLEHIAQIVDLGRKHEAYDAQARTNLLLGAA